eukprot:3063106-Prymnesium_polylepis.1
MPSCTNSRWPCAGWTATGVPAPVQGGRLTYQVSRGCSGPDMRAPGWSAAGAYTSFRSPCYRASQSWRQRGRHRQRRTRYATRMR